MANFFVDTDLCKRCSICSIVCPVRIIDRADKNTLPQVNDENAGLCIRCGHCEVHCPSQALTLNFHPEEKVSLPAEAGIIAPEDLSLYLRKRRSVRRFTKDPVPKEKILEILEIARYAASGCNGQPVEWIVVHDPAKVKKIAGLTIEWMKTLGGTFEGLIKGWESGSDVICCDAPHMLFAHYSDNNPTAPVDATIALTHFHIAAPAYGIGSCFAGFVSMAAESYEPLQKELGLPAGRKPAYALLFGNPRFKVYGLPRRNPLAVTWQ